MGLSSSLKQDVIELLISVILEKLERYSPESSHMPFHYRLLGKDRMVLFSFIHSLNTTFGTSIFEPVAALIAKERFADVRLHVKPFDQINEQAEQEVQNLMRELISAKSSPNKEEELRRLSHCIKASSGKAKLKKVKLTAVDIWLRGASGEIYLIDLKTAKPNRGEFQRIKRTLLEWAATEMTRDPEAKVYTMIGIPYNPYDPEPYHRWTLRGLLDLNQEVLVAEELWDFLGGEGTYPDLLNCFEQAGIRLRPQLDAYFARFRD